MANTTLNDLLIQYERKKTKAEMDLENRKKNLYEKIPELLQIEEELNTYAINTAKNILNNITTDTKELNKKIDDLKLQKEKILEANHIDVNYLKPFYECTKCKDTGYYTDSNYKSVMCSCLKQKLLNISYNKSNISNLYKENFDTFDDTLFSDEVDISKYKFNISPRKNINNIRLKCLNFVNNFDDLSTKNLLFTGNTGLRKNFYV